MTLLESIVSDYLITEGASADEINSAIDGMHPAKIKYDSDDKGEATGYRHIYPVAYTFTFNAKDQDGQDYILENAFKEV